MPTYLEKEGLARKRPCIGYAVWEPPIEKPWPISFTTEIGTGDEILQTFMEPMQIEEVYKDGSKVRVDRKTEVEKWIGEMSRRLFLPWIPEPIYTKEDLEKLRNDFTMRILTQKERDVY